MPARQHDEHATDAPVQCRSLRQRRIGRSTFFKILSIIYQVFWELRKNRKIIQMRVHNYRATVQRYYATTHIARNSKHSTKYCCVCAEKFIRDSVVSRFYNFPLSFCPSRTKLAGATSSNRLKFHLARLDSTRSTLSSQSRKSRRACRARRAVLFQHGGRRTILYKLI